MSGCDAVVHATAHFPSAASDPNAWSVNCQGLWNVLDCARNSDTVKRVVHIGSCHTVWPGSTTHPEQASRFFDADVRRPDASIYSVTKRLQEEMCRQFYDAEGLRIVVLRPDGIIDLRHGRSRDSGRGPRATAPITERPRVGSVCRYDIANACRAAILIEDDADFVRRTIRTIPAEPSALRSSSYHLR